MSYYSYYFFFQQVVRSLRTTTFLCSYVSKYMILLIYKKHHLIRTKKKEVEEDLFSRLITYWKHPNAGPAAPGRDYIYASLETLFALFFNKSFFSHFMSRWLKKISLRWGKSRRSGTWLILSERSGEVSSVIRFTYAMRYCNFSEPKSPTKSPFTRKEMM